MTTRADLMAEYRHLCSAIVDWEIVYPGLRSMSMRAAFSDKIQSLRLQRDAVLVQIVALETATNNDVDRPSYLR